MSESLVPEPSCATLRKPRTVRALEALAERPLTNHQLQDRFDMTANEVTRMMGSLRRQGRVRSTIRRFGAGILATYELADSGGVEALWARIREAVRLANLEGMAQVTLELRDAESLIVMAER